jgi:hypothetical protein
MSWQGAKATFEWVIIPLLVVLLWVPWRLLYDWVKQETKKPSKEVM